MVQIVAMSVASCTAGQFPHADVELTGATMGTSFSVRIVDPPTTTELEVLRGEIEVQLTDVEQLASTYLADSELTRFNRIGSTEWVAVSAEFCELLQLAEQMSRMSGGAFDPTVGPAVDLWGFGPAGTVSRPPSGEQVAAAKRRIGYARLELDCTVPAARKRVPDLALDLSGLAKGYGVDRLADVLDRHAIANYLVEIGGEIRQRGQNASAGQWRIAIERPDSNGRQAVEEIVRVSGRAVATSGDYRNFFVHDSVRYSHTIDPATASPVTHDLASVTIVSDSAATADGLATALLVLGPGEGRDVAEREGIAAFFLMRNAGGFSAYASPQFRAVTDYEGTNPGL